MLKASHDLFIIIVCELKQWPPLNYLMKVSFYITVIMNTYASNVKIATINNGKRN
jgi:hypothetical protein